jgi:hypothetical protein
MSASESWSAQQEALAVQALRGSGRLRLRVRGESMLPTLWPGDIAEIAVCSLGEVGGDEILLAFREGRFFLHRFLARDENAGFITRGDSMPGPDPVFPSDALLGRLVTVFRDGQPMALPARPWARVVGLLFCYCDLARRVALRHRSSTRSHRLLSTDLEAT